MRQDYVQVSSCSHRDTLGVLPYGKHKRQYVTVGDDTGEILTFGVKRGDKKIIFKSVVDNEKREILNSLNDKNYGPNANTEITALSMSGKDGDRIFVSTETDVYGLKRSKGNMFQHFSSNMTETIKNLKVLGDVGRKQQYWTSGEYTFSMHDEGQGQNIFDEKVFYACQDKINDFDVKKYTIEYDSKRAGILGCDDGTIRKIDGGELVAEANVRKAVTKVVIPKVFPNATSDNNKIVLNEERYLSSNDVIFGTRRGHVGLLSFDVNNDVQKVWNISGNKRDENSSVSPKTKRQAAVTCIKLFDITNDGVNDFIVGREDGTLQIYCKSDIDTQPSMTFSSTVHDNICTLATGVVSTPGYNEIVMNTFSGRVLAFTTEQLQEKAEGDKYGRSKATLAKEATISGLNADLKSLQKQIEKEAKVLRKGIAKKSGGSEEIGTIRSMDMHFKVKVFFDLIEEEAAYKLAIESSTPIEQIILKSSIGVDIMESDDSETIVSITRDPYDLQGSQPILATFRNDQMLEKRTSTSKGETTEGETTYTTRARGSTSKRMELKVRTVEGQGGNISLYIIAAHENRDEASVMKIGQTAQCVMVEVPPLSLHCRSETPKYPIHKLPLNVLEIKKYTSLNQIHEWLRNILPSFPRRTLAANTENEMYCYENTLVGSLLVIQYSEEKVQLSSDSISTISILKENINALAMRSNVHINISIKVNETSVIRFLALVEPKLKAQLSLATQVKYIDALAEVSGGNGGIPSYLAPDLQYIMRNAKTIRRKFKRSAKIIRFWYGVITDLYIDLNRCKGINASQNIPHLMNALENFNMDNVLSIFGIQREDIGRHEEQSKKDEEEFLKSEKKKKKERKKKRKMEKEKKGREKEAMQRDEALKK